MMVTNSKLPTAEEPSFSLLASWIQTVKMPFEDRQSMFFTPSFSKKYLSISLSSQENRVSKLDFLWKRIDSLQNDEPFGIIQINSNPELWDTPWDDFEHLVVGNLVYMALCNSSDSSGMLVGFQEIGLACFSMNPHSNSTKKISAIKYKVNQQDYLSPTRSLDYRQQALYQFTSLISIKGRVFALASLSTKSWYLKIHSFYRSKILLIGGSNMKTPGHYALGPHTEILRVDQDAHLAGYFGYTRIVSAHNKTQDVLSCFRYILV